MTLHRLNHALAFVFGGYQDYDKFYTPSLLDEDAGLFVAIVEQLSERTEQSERLSARESNKKEVDAGRIDDVDNDQEEPSSIDPTAANADEETGNIPTESQDEPGGQTPEGPLPQKESAENVAEDEVNVSPVGNSTELSFNPEVSVKTSQGGGEEEENDAGIVELTGEEVNAARLATAHVQLKRLKGHQCNIFEAAFFYDPEGDRGEYYLNVIQVVATYLAMLFLFYFLGAEIRKQFKDRNVFLQDEDGNDKEWQGILVINAISLGYFFFLVGRDVERVILFNKCMIKLCPRDSGYTSYTVQSHRYWTLASNFGFNVLLAYCLFVLNFFFIQSVDNMNDAILNAIAVVFIVQIDDIIPPYVRIHRKVYLLSIPVCPVRLSYWFDWENSNIHPKMMAVVEEYLSYPDSPEEAITVKKISGESVVYRESDVCYFFLNKEESLIRIFHGRLMDGKYKHFFKEVTYKVDGPGAQQFVKTMSYFECVEEESGPKKLEVSSTRVITRSQIESTKKSPLKRNGLKILRTRQAESTDD